MCESFRLLCALCRVGLYALYRRLCCKGPSPVRPNFAILCIGLENAGKSSVISLLSGDDLHKVEPTVGFSIKAVLFEDCILDIKELGGGDKVRPYWERYFQVFQGMIFVLDSSSGNEKLEIAKAEFHKAAKHHQLKGIPILILATYQDVEGALSTAEISHFLEVESELAGRQWLLQGCSINDKESLKATFLQFNQLLLKNLESDMEERSKNSPQHSNRL